MKGINLVYKKADVAIVGAGIAGLTAAYQLQKKGYKVQVFEAAKEVGGRIRTDKVEGFLLDRGLQLFYTSYPEVKSFIDSKKLNVKPIYNGALVRYNGDFSLVSNPNKQLKDILGTLVASNSNWRDKLKMMRLLADANTLNERKLISKNDISTEQYLEEAGFSDKFINSFFKPFLASTFLDDDLKTPSRLMKFIFKMFDKGIVGLPEKGMSSVPEQLASKLERGTVNLQSKVKKVSSAGLQLLKGEFITADRVLIATNSPSLSKLLPDYEVGLSPRHVSCLYFATEVPPVSKPVIILNGEEKGLVNNLCVVSLVQPSYAPEGSHLVAINITKHHDYDDEELVDEVLKEMAHWFGVNVNNWQHLRTYHIKNALPQSDKVVSDAYAVQYNDTVFVCGDHLSYGSMNAAIKSGKIAANMLHKDLKKAKKGHPIHQV